MLKAFRYEHLGATSAQLEHQGYQPTPTPGMDVQAAIALAYKKAANSVFTPKSLLTHEMNKVLGEPTWSTPLAIFYIFANTVLTILNFYWFFLMVLAVTKRFRFDPTKSKRKLPAWAQHEADLLAAEDKKKEDEEEEEEDEKHALLETSDGASISESSDDESDAKDSKHRNKRDS